jgi:hypothetical protein
MRGFNIANAGCKRKIKRLQEQIERAAGELKKVPKKVRLKTIDRQPVRLEKERKYLSDVIKMSCYRTESSLLNLLYSHFVGAGEEGRAFLKGLFELPADIVPDEKERDIRQECRRGTTPIRRICFKVCLARKANGVDRGRAGSIRRRMAVGKGGLPARYPPDQ